QTPARPTVDFCPRLKPPAVYAHRSPLGTYLRCPTISALGSTEPNQLRYPRRPRYLVKQESGGLLLLRRITPRFRGVMRSIFTLALRIVSSHIVYQAPEITLLRGRPTLAAAASAQ